MFSLLLNNQSVSFREGQTVLEVLKENLYVLPSLCFNSELSQSESCRMCLVEDLDEGRFITSCSVPAKNGMRLLTTNPSLQVNVKWALDFHLTNHPMDCPECAKVGECQLQEIYMKNGRYLSEMAERKNHKEKTVSLGSTITLDQERCTVCQICTNFTSEVTKTYDLVVVGRGGDARIETTAGAPFENPYSLNTVDLCPTGALFPKLYIGKPWREKPMSGICTLCSSGCNVFYHVADAGVSRLTPRKNDRINGSWMCDEGRDIERFSLSRRQKNTLRYKDDECEDLGFDELSHLLGSELSQQVPGQGDRLALIVTPQFSNEDYIAFLEGYSRVFPNSTIYLWEGKLTGDEFDGFLLRGDKNPNQQGLKEVLSLLSLQAKDMSEFPVSEKYDWVVVLGPENSDPFFSQKEILKSISSVPNALWLLSSQFALGARSKNTWLVPVKMSIEKSGTYVNHAGIAQKLDALVSAPSGIYDIGKLVNSIFREIK